MPAEADHRVRQVLASLLLVNEVAEADTNQQRKRDKIIIRCGRSGLLCLGKTGRLSRGAEPLFQMLTEGVERCAEAIATNEPFSNGANTFIDPRPCAANIPSRKPVTSGGRGEASLLLRTSKTTAGPVGFEDGSGGQAMGHVLWMVNHYAAMPSEPGGTRHYWLGRGLQDLGWDVRIIRSGSTTPPRRPWEPQVKVTDGLEVTTIPGLPSTVRGLKRVRSWAGFSGWLQRPTTTRHLPKPDVVLGSTVHLGAAWAARRLAERHGVPFVLEIRDLWPETLIAMGALKRGSAIARAMSRLEGSLAASAALIVSPLSGVGEYMTKRHGISRDRFVWVSNGVNTEQYAGISSPPATSLRLQYFGAIGTANDVGSIVDAVERANESLAEPVQMQVFGSGPQRSVLIDRIAADPRLAAVISFPEPVPSHQVPMAMEWGNALVLTVRQLPGLYRYGISMNKLFDYLASGRWIIMGSDVPGNPIAEAPGLSLSDPSVDGLSSAIAETARMDPDERIRIAHGNTGLARERYDYRVLARELALSLERVLDDRGLAKS